MKSYWNPSSFMILNSSNYGKLFIGCIIEQTTRRKENIHIGSIFSNLSNSEMSLLADGRRTSADIISMTAY
jgi:hypothetical protein